MMNLRALALPLGLCLVAAACGSSSTGGVGGKGGGAGGAGAGGASATSCLPPLPSTGSCTQADLSTYGNCFLTQCPAFQACYAAGGDCAAGCTPACSTCVTTTATDCAKTVCPPPACISGAGGAGGGACLAQLADCCAHAAGAAMIAACGMEYQDILSNGDLAETACGVKLANLKATYCP